MNDQATSDHPAERMAEQHPPRSVARAGRGALLGAMFLMATSAIGPGFITQTTVFTEQLGAAFAFAIVVSILVDIAVQLNVWRVIGVSGMRAQDLANKVVPGAGYALAVLVVLGGLVFNIGNIGGTALGMNAMLGMDVKLGGAISAVVAIAVFLSRRAGVAMDRIVVVLGVLMIGMVLYTAFASQPRSATPCGRACCPNRSASSSSPRWSAGRSAATSPMQERTAWWTPGSPVPSTSG
jgi:Mn2+/Fe2+ NRAMP family transporter